jgi:hypothetical protein
MLDRVLRLVVTTLFFGGLLFLTAGTVAWPAAWAYLALVTASLVVYSVNIVRPVPIREAPRLRRFDPADVRYRVRARVLVGAGCRCGGVPGGRRANLCRGSDVAA